MRRGDVLTTRRIFELEFHNVGATCSAVSPGKPESFRNGKGINKRQTQQSVEILYVFSVVVPLLQTMRK